ncbi:MAG: hypothetical protein M0Z67_12865 [Nitrospiraceae bacterium]|nr:hypothetical protein [Nitrospiraceae bacterium]
MRKSILFTVIVLFCAAVAFAGTFGKMDLKVGDEVYACNCGADCPCQTMARMPGKCTCGNEMVKAKVMKVEEGRVMLKADSWEKERSFKTTGKYACACGADCKCEAISQNPGKCPCGMEMKKVE